MKEESLYYLQPDGSWKRNGDGRSPGRKRKDIPRGEKIVEDAPTNSAGAGAVDGIGVGSDGEPGRSKKFNPKLELKKRFEYFVRKLK